MSHESFTVYCLKCNILVESQVIAAGAAEFKNSALHPMDVTDSQFTQEHYYVTLCRKCESPFLLHSCVCGVPGEFESVSDETVLFPTALAPSLMGLPVAVSRPLEQAYRTFATACYEASALMCRRALEALCSVTGARGNTLAARLSDLKSKGKIDTKLVTWANGVRLVGNEAAHDVETETSLEDARDILDFTEALLLYAYSLDAKFQAFEARRRSHRSSP